MASRSSWSRKFAAAFRGIARGMRRERSFCVHLPMASAVLVAAAVLSLHGWEWVALIICIGGVLAAELFNSALESFARALDRPEDPDIGDALDIAAGAVLVISFAAAVVGCFILGAALAR